MTLSITGSWITAEAGFEWTELHILLGYFTLSLILFRIIWGFLGTRHARFSQFIQPPTAFAKSLRHLFSRAPSKEAGHTAAGGWSILIMLALVTIQAGSGLFVSDDIFWMGPYNSTVSAEIAGKLAYVHHTNFILLQIIIALHICAIAWYKWGKKTDLVRPMFTGNKLIANRQAGIKDSRIRVALWVMLAAVTTIFLLVNLAPPPPLDDYIF
ncbi:MAG: cytochrome B [Gammaproteobacteria bacterium]|nr:cytochrome B [Gammaproteobacteria bacterium]MCH1550283.1 cytochrome b/b6 domain-containing protein [Pseudomonadales bacterium]